MGSEMCIRDSDISDDIMPTDPVFNFKESREETIQLYKPDPKSSHTYKQKSPRKSELSYKKPGRPKGSKAPRVSKHSQMDYTYPGVVGVIYGTRSWIKVSQT